MYELRSVLAFEMMDDSHIQWLQMACAIWGKKYNFIVFQISGISWVCNTLANEEQDISVFCPCLAIKLHKKLLKSS
jgi:hypothetical protein